MLSCKNCFNMMDRSSCFNCYPLSRKTNFCIMMSDDSKNLINLAFSSDLFYIIDNISEYQKNSKLIWKVLGYILEVPEHLTFDDIKHRIKIDPVVKNLFATKERQKPYYINWKSPGYFLQNPALIEFSFELHESPELKNLLDKAKLISKFQSSLSPR